MKRHNFDNNVLYPVYGLAEATLGVTFPNVNESIRSVKVYRDQVTIGKCINVNVLDEVNE
jgi:fengycin family lipopeptide synthetase D